MIPGEDEDNPMSEELIALAKDYFKRTKGGCLNSFLWVREEAMREIALEKHPEGIFQIYRYIRRSNWDRETHQYLTKEEKISGIGFREISRYSKGFSVRLTYKYETLKDSELQEYYLDTNYAQSGSYLTITNYVLWESFLRACGKFNVPSKMFEMFEQQAKVRGLI